VELLGGKCSKCGWSGDIAVLQFHHTESDKEFGVSSSLHKSWDVVEKELQKCVLLCANCHCLEHTVRPSAFYDEVDRYQGKRI
jgi:hypothetical protein